MVLKEVKCAARIAIKFGIKVATSLGRIIIVQYHRGYFVYFRKNYSFAVSSVVPGLCVFLFVFVL